MLKHVFIDEHYFQNINYHEYSNKAADGVQYTAIGVCILFSLASLFGVVGSITVNSHIFVGLV